MFSRKCIIIFSLLCCIFFFSSLNAQVYGKYEFRLHSQLVYFDKTVKQYNEKVGHELKRLALRRKLEIERRGNIAEKSLKVYKRDVNDRSAWLIDGYAAELKVVEAYGEAAYAIAKVAVAIAKIFVFKGASGQVLDVGEGLWDAAEMTYYVLRTKKEYQNYLRSGNSKDLSEDTKEELKQIVNERFRKTACKALAKIGKHSSRKVLKALKNIPFDGLIDLFDGFYAAYNIRRHLKQMDKEGWQKEYLKEVQKQFRTRRKSAIVFAMKKQFTRVASGMVAKLTGTQGSKYEEQVKTIEKYIRLEYRHYENAKKIVSRQFALHSNYVNEGIRFIKNSLEDLKRLESRLKDLKRMKNELEKAAQFTNFSKKTIARIQKLIKLLSSYIKEKEEILTKTRNTLEDELKYFLYEYQNIHTDLFVQMDEWGEYREATAISFAEKTLKKITRERNRKIIKNKVVNAMLKSAKDWEDERKRETDIYPNFLMAANSKNYQKLIDDILENVKESTERDKKERDILEQKMTHKLKSVTLPVFTPQSWSFEYQGTLNEGEKITSVEIFLQPGAKSKKIYNTSYSHYVRKTLALLPVGIKKTSSGIDYDPNKYVIVGHSDRGDKIRLSGKIVSSTLPIWNKKTPYTYHGPATVKFKVEWTETKRFLSKDGEKIVNIPKKQFVTLKFNFWNIKTLKILKKEGPKDVEVEDFHILYEKELESSTQKACFVNNAHCQVIAVFQCRDKIKQAPLVGNLAGKFATQDIAVANFNNDRLMLSPLKEGTSTFQCTYPLDRSISIKTFDINIFEIKLYLKKIKNNPINKRNFKVALPEDIYELKVKISENISPELKSKIKIKWKSPYMLNFKERSFASSNTIINGIKSPETLAELIKIPIEIVVDETYRFTKSTFIYNDDPDFWPQIYWHKLARRYLPDYGKDVVKLIVPKGKLEIKYYRPFSVFAGKKEQLEARVYKVYKVRQADMNSALLVKWKEYPLQNVPLSGKEGEILKNYIAKWGGVAKEKDLSQVESLFEMGTDKIWYTKTSWNVPKDAGKTKETEQGDIEVELIRK